MRTVDFFNLFPEEVAFIKQHFGEHKTLKSISEQMGQELDIVQRVEASVVLKISSGLRNCGVKVHGPELRFIMSRGLIELKDVLERSEDASKKV